MLARGFKMTDTLIFFFSSIFRIWKTGCFAKIQTLLCFPSKRVAVKEPYGAHARSLLPPPWFQISFRAGDTEVFGTETNWHLLACISHLLRWDCGSNC